MKYQSEILTQMIIISLALFGFVIPSEKASAQIAATIIIDPTAGLVTDENGGTATFTVQMDSKPEQNVSIEFTSSDSSEGIVSPNKITINPGNWDKPEQNLITVTGVPDNIEDGDIPYTIIGVASSGESVPSVSVINLNDPFPIANDDYPQIDGYSPIIVRVLDNDTTLIDLPIEISVISDPSFGTYIINPDPDNTITYDPSEETFQGLDQFTYQVCDFDGDCSSAQVFIEDQVLPEIVSAAPVDLGDTLEVIDEAININVEASDNFLVDCVSFIRWDALLEQFITLSEDCQAPYQYTLDGQSLNYGWNQVFFIATDMAGNSSEYQYFVWFFRVSRTFIPVLLSPN